MKDQCRKFGAPGTCLNPVCQNTLPQEFSYYLRHSVFPFGIFRGQAFRFSETLWWSSHRKKCGRETAKSHPPNPLLKVEEGFSSNKLQHYSCSTMPGFPCRSNILEAHDKAKAGWKVLSSCGPRSSFSYRSKHKRQQYQPGVHVTWRNVFLYRQGWTA